MTPKPEIRIPMVGNDSEGCILASAGPKLDRRAGYGHTIMERLHCGDGPLHIDRIGLTPGTAAVLRSTTICYLSSPSRWPQAATRCYSAVYAAVCKTLPGQYSDHLKRSHEGEHHHTDRHRGLQCGYRLRAGYRCQDTECRNMME